MSRIVVLKVKDFGFPQNDERFGGDRVVDLDNPPAAAALAPGGFLGPLEGPFADIVKKNDENKKAASESGVGAQ